MFQSAQDVGDEHLSLLVSPVSPVRRRNPAQEPPPRSQSCKRLSSLGTRGSRRESCIGGFSSEGASASHRTICGSAGKADNSVHRTCQWVQWAQDWHSQCSKELDAEERLVRLRAEEVHPMEEVFVTDWEAEAKALRQSTTIFGVEPCCCVPSRAVFRRRSSSGGTGTRHQTTSLRRRSSIVSPTPFGAVVCEASGVERRSGNGRPIDCCGAHSTSGCRWCEDADNVRSKMILLNNGKRERKRERELGMECGRGRRSSPPRPLSRRRRISSSDECVSEENPGPARSRSKILHGSEAVEYDLTWGDSEKNRGRDST